MNRWTSFATQLAYLVGINVIAYFGLHNHTWAHNLLMANNLLLSIGTFGFFVLYALDDRRDDDPGPRRMYKKYKELYQTKPRPLEVPGVQGFYVAYVITIIAAGHVASGVVVLIGLALVQGCLREMKNRYRDEQARLSLRGLYIKGGEGGRHDG